MRSEKREPTEELPRSQAEACDQGSFQEPGGSSRDPPRKFDPEKGPNSPRSDLKKKPGGDVVVAVIAGVVNGVILYAVNCPLFGRWCVSNLLCEKSIFF